MDTQPGIFVQHHAETGLVERELREHLGSPSGKHWDYNGTLILGSCEALRHRRNSVSAELPEEG